MNKEKKEIIANNILELLFDPTIFPIEKRLYFRPEEILKNQSYEFAKAESYKSYGDQRHNSDFYPKSKMSNEREATSMDRKTLIASMDILSQNFREEDPIGKDLRTMAYAISKMSDEELESRLLTEVEAKRKYETFSCPECGIKVLKQTGYCVKCKKKVKPKTADEIKKAEKEIDLDIWSKEASEAVKKALITDVIGDIEVDAEEETMEKKAGKIKGPGISDGTGPMSGTPGCPMTKKKKTEEEKEAGKKEETTPEPEKEAGKKEETTPEPEKKEEKEAGKKEETTPEPEKKEEKEATEPNAVNTDILGIQMEASMILPEELGDLSPEEEQRLSQLFS